MKYFAVQARTTAEEKFITLYKKCNEGDSVAFYFPKKRMMIRRKGKKIADVTPIFPGYIFAELEEAYPCALFYQNLKKVGEFFRVLPSKYDMQPLRGANLELISRFLTKNGEPIGLSQVKFNENQRIVVISGPMEGLEGKIVKVDKRKQRAKIRVNLFATEVTMDLGFEIITAPR